MSVTPTKVLIDISKLENLADKVRAKAGTQAEMTVDEMATAVENIGEIILPPEYQKVDYLTSTGTQRIETGLVNNAYNVPVKYEFGVSYPSTSARQLHGSQGAFYIGVVSGKWQTGQGGTTGSGTALANTWYNVKYYASGETGTSAPRKGVYANLGDDMDVQVYSYSYTFDISDDYQICVFSLNGQNLPSSCSVSYFKVWQGGTLQRHLVPCYRKSDKEIGMYDIVNGVFYTNAGTGNFTCYPAPPST